MDVLTGSVTTVVPVLLVLALVDSLSVGTLAIPVWLMLAPGRLRVPRVLTYLATVGLFYFLVGALLLTGARNLIPRGGIDWDSPVTPLLAFLAGAALLALSFVVYPPGGRRGTPGTGAAGRLSRWRASAMQAGGPSSPGTDDARTRGAAPVVSLVGIALVATSLELGTMLPYLAAIALLAGDGPGAGAQLLLLAGYCVVMLLPALVLLLGRAVASRTLDPALRWLDGWFERDGGQTLGWVLGIVGVLLMARTLSSVLALLPGQL